MYVTPKLGDNRCCRIHSISDDGNGWIVTNERYVAMPWKMVTRNGTNMTLTEVVDGILSRQESEAKERKRRKREKEEIEKKRKEHYEADVKEETKKLNKLVDWHKCKLNEIRETHVQSVFWILAEFCYNRSPQGPYTSTCTILQETINGFLCPLIVFRKHYH